MPESTTSQPAVSGGGPYTWTSPPPAEDPPSEYVSLTRSWGGVPALNCRTMNSATSLPHGWMCFAHLDGTVYYYDTRRRIVTPEDINEPAIYTKYTAAVERFTAETNNIPGFQAVSAWQTLVVKGLDDPTGPTTYIMDYENGLYIEIVSKDPSNKHIHTEYKTEKFWNAINAFPMHLIRVPKDIDVDFLGALSFGASERIMEWNETSFPFTDEQTRRLVQVYRDLKGDLDKGTDVIPAFCWHISRVMSRIEIARKKSQFGTYDFQLYRNVVPDPVGWEIKIADACLFLVLFGAHRTYRMRLQGARVKGEVYLADFRELLNNFLAEWSDSNLLATVFVGANIAFLAVPDITNTQRTASLASTVFSLLSVASGVHHVWQHRTKLDASYDEAQKYLSHLQSTSGRDADLAITACFLSIPLVALLYAVLSFSVALGSFCIESNNTHSEILLAVVLGVAGTAGLGTLLFFWHVWRGPRMNEVSEEEEEEWNYGWVARIKSGLNGAREGLRKGVGRLRLLKGKAKDEKDVASVLP